MPITSRKAVSGVSLLAVVVGVLASPVPAAAAIVTVPAIAFVPRGTAAAGDVLQGLLANNGDPGIYYAFTPLTAGESVCRVLLWARDNDGDFNITARLVRKQLVNGPGTGFGPPPQVMATVATSGGSGDLQRILTSVITNPLVSTSYVYWLELDFPGGFMEAFSVRVVTQQVC